MKKKYIVVMDVPGIKKYVFGTDRLVEIRGASALLTELNENGVPTLLKETLDEAHFDLVFSGGEQDNSSSKRSCQPLSLP
ncbi:MAG TPA: hypothetical protein DCR95_03575 [Desulfobacter sp.]|uniref:hypothetical protein n=1 Tax=Desulfobacter sp. UBA2225 TaxID=1961413 RepID=UPI000E95F07C|nr:hypothetical protein [Desulfobacter sp. UBA2225]HAR33184.1 hypothetical protein [Desulfobacter sp.]